MEQRPRHRALLVAHPHPSRSRNCRLCLLRWLVLYRFILQMISNISIPKESQSPASPGCVHANPLFALEHLCTLRYLSHFWIFIHPSHPGPSQSFLQPFPPHSAVSCCEKFPFQLQLPPTASTAPGVVFPRKHPPHLQGHSYFSLNPLMQETTPSPVPNP